MSAIDTLARSERLEDPENESIRILLACAWACSPRPDLAEFVGSAATLVPQLRPVDPTRLASVARSMNLPGIGED